MSKQALPTVWLPGEGDDMQFAADYTGLWAIEPGFMRSGLDFVNSIDLAAHIISVRESGTPVCNGRMTRVRLKRADDQFRGNEFNQPAIAVIEIRGAMMKRASSLMESTSTIRARQMVREAANDNDIGGILVVIDSPGGTVAGTEDLANELRRAAEMKPLFVHAQDCMCSAAMWIGMQADRVTANARTAEIGSIGVMIGLYDRSREYQQAGIEPIVIATGERKGWWIHGREITDDVKEQLQQSVDRTAAVFREAVSRRISADVLDQLMSTADTVDADQAIEMEIIDGIESFEDAVQSLFERITGGTMSGQSAEYDAGKMNVTLTTEKDQADAGTKQKDAETKETGSQTGEQQTVDTTANAGNEPARADDDKPADLSWMEERFTKADAQFHLECLRDGLTRREAGERYIGMLQERVEKAESEADAATKRADAAKASRELGGDEAIDTGTDDTGTGQAGETRPGKQQTDPRARLSDVITVPTRK